MDFYKIIYICTFIPPLICFIGGLFGIINFKNINESYKILTILLSLSFLNDVISRIFPLFWGSNLFFMSSYAIIEFVLIYLFLKDSFLKNKVVLNSIFFMVITFNLYEILTVDYFNFATFQVYSRALNSFVLLILTGLIILQKIKDEKLDEINKIHFILPCYLGIAALLSLPLNFLINYIESQVYFVWLVNVFNVFLLYSVLTYQLWKYGRTQKI